MKCIKIGNTIASLEDVKSVEIISKDTIKITYFAGGISPLSGLFINQNVHFHHLKNPEEVLKEIYLRL